MADEAAERTEQPTPRRREEALEKGQVPRSTDLLAAAGLLSGLLLLRGFGPSILDCMVRLVRRLDELDDVRPEAIWPWFLSVGRESVELLLPLIGLLLAITAAVAIAQTGLHLFWSRLKLKFDQINPVNGVKRLFAMEPLIRVGFGVLKIILLSAVAWVTAVAQLPAVLASAKLGAAAILLSGSTLIFDLGIRIGAVLLVLGLADYFVNRWRMEQKLKMTRQEVRDETKNMEGDPHIKARRRQTQMKLAMQRLGQTVPQADVVVTNPTEYAVALRYDEATMRAPRVVAKGVDLLAARIRQLAEQHGVPLVQRPPLARALYSGVEVGQEVPPQFYRAVAELLAYVYQLARKAG